MKLVPTCRDSLFISKSASRKKFPCHYGSRIKEELCTLTCMAKEATQYFYVAVFGATFGLFGQGVPLPGAPPENISTNGLPTIEGSTNAIPPIISTNILPIVEGGTNAVLTAEEKELQMLEEARLKAEEEYNRRVAEARKKWEAATNGLGSYHVIPGKNPFRLTKPEIPKPKPVTVVKTTITVGVPHLAGISMLRNNKRAVLRINPPEGGAAEYKFIGEGERIWEVEVLKIDPERGIVEVKVKNRTHSLELVPTLQVNVRELQQALNFELKSTRKLKVDGDFGSNTKNALMQFQRLNKLPANGRVDEATRKALGLSSPARTTRAPSQRK